MIESRKMVPRALTRSRDYQGLLKLVDIIMSTIKFDTDNFINLVNPKQCPVNLLPLLSGYVGYEYDNKETIRANRMIIEQFPYLIRNRGSETGFSLAVSLAINASGKFNVSDVSSMFYVDFIEDEDQWGRKTGYVKIYIYYDGYLSKLWDLIEVVRPIGVTVDVIPAVPITKDQIHQIQISDNLYISKYNYITGYLVCITDSYGHKFDIQIGENGNIVNSRYYIYSKAKDGSIELTNYVINGEGYFEELFVDINKNEKYRYVNCSNDTNSEIRLCVDRDGYILYSMYDNSDITIDAPASEKIRYEGNLNKDIVSHSWRYIHNFKDMMYNIMCPFSYNDVFATSNESEESLWNYIENNKIPTIFMSDKYTFIHENNGLIRIGGTLKNTKNSNTRKSVWVEIDENGNIVKRDSYWYNKFYKDDGSFDYDSWRYFILDGYKNDDGIEVFKMFLVNKFVYLVELVPKDSNGLYINTIDFELGSSGNLQGYRYLNDKNPVFTLSDYEQFLENGTNNKTGFTITTKRPISSSTDKNSSPIEENLYTIKKYIYTQGYFNKDKASEFYKHIMSGSNPYGSKDYVTVGESTIISILSESPWYFPIVSQGFTSLFIKYGTLLYGNDVRDENGHLIAEIGTDIDGYFIDDLGNIRRYSGTDDIISKPDGPVILTRRDRYLICSGHDGSIGFSEVHNNNIDPYINTNLLSYENFEIWSNFDCIKSDDLANLVDNRYLVSAGNYAYRLEIKNQQDRLRLLSIPNMNAGNKYTISARIRNFSDTDIIDKVFLYEIYEDEDGKLYYPIDKDNKSQTRRYEMKLTPTDSIEWKGYVYDYIPEKTPKYLEINFCTVDKEGNEIWNVTGLIDDIKITN